MKSQGRAAWRRFQTALAEGRMPAREVLDGVLVIFGGALLLTPGFLTDFLGLVLLLPPTRAVVRQVLVRRFGARLVASAASGTQVRFGRMFGAGGTPPRAADEDTVEGTATEVRRRRGELP
jgi:UPF0716 protein FxsA